MPSSSATATTAQSTFGQPAQEGNRQFTEYAVTPVRIFEQSRGSQSGTETTGHSPLDTVQPTR